MADRDPEVADLYRQSLKLVVQAEMLYHDLTKHQEALLTFLQKLDDATLEEGSDDPAG